MSDKTITLAANHAALVTRMLIVGLQSYAEVMRSNEIADAYKESKTYRIPDGVLPDDPTGDLDTYVEFAEALSWMNFAMNKAIE